MIILHLRKMKVEGQRLKVYFILNSLIFVMWLFVIKLKKTIDEVYLSDNLQINHIFITGVFF